MQTRPRGALVSKRRGPDSSWKASADDESCVYSCLLISVQISQTKTSGQLIPDQLLSVTGSSWVRSLPRRQPSLGGVGRLRLARHAVAQVQPEHALCVQLQQELKLHWHGVELLLSLYVVIVVVLQGAESVRVVAEGPEAVQVHVAAEFQRQAGHD